MHICLSCFKEYDAEFGVCPFCGEPEITEPLQPVHLMPGTILQDRFLIGRGVGSGGFGIIYKAWDLKLEAVVAVKEFFSGRLMTRAVGTEEIIVNSKSQAEFAYRKERFLAEARNMAKCSSHRNIPNVFEFFEANGTAYIVMELLVGQPLNAYLGQMKGPIDTDFALYITNEVGNALKALHKLGIVHRDVAPDNIFICSDHELRIILLDLGAAILADNTDKVIDKILKPGYSPAEQYDNTMKFGPWTDVYALGATLYVMLTGEKPDEATNRKIKDVVRPPHELNSEIPENLSNAVMKAIAVHKHMRFKTVDEFLNAINGEKKVLPLAKERKLKRYRRFGGVAAACLVLLLSGGLVWNAFLHKRAEALLDDATIRLWFSLSEDFNEKEALESIASNFHEKFPNVTVEVRAIAPENYQKELEKAAANHTLPTLFESTDLPDSLLRGAADLSDVLSSEQADSCLFLKQYSGYYSEKKRLPLSIEVPMAYVITGGPLSLPYEKTVFGSLSDFGSDAVFSSDSRYAALLSQNLDVSGMAGREAFLDPTANTANVLLSSSLAMNDVRRLTDYQKVCVFYDSREIFCRFTYEWSVGEGSREEIAAGKRLLCWMLGNAYQNTLMISSGSSEGGESNVPVYIPVNGTCFRQKANTLSDYQPLLKIYSHFVFKK